MIASKKPYESEEEYKKRQGKLERAIGAGGGRWMLITNICVQVGSDGGTLRGAHPTLITSPAGDIAPEYTTDGLLIYAFYWDTSNGDMIAQFGDAGDEQINDTSQIVAVGNNKIALNWDAANSYYYGNDQEVIDEITTPVGEVGCFLMPSTPDVVLHNDYEEPILETEAGIT
jgi:hypothetical protein